MNLTVCQLKDFFFFSPSDSVGVNHVHFNNQKGRKEERGKQKIIIKNSRGGGSFDEEQ